MAGENAKWQDLKGGDMCVGIRYQAQKLGYNHRYNFPGLGPGYPHPHQQVIIRLFYGLLTLASEMDTI